MVINQWQLNLTQYWDLESPPTSNRSSPVSAYESPNTTNNNHMVKSSTASLPTPPEQVRTSNYYSHSINVNLNATPRFNKTKLLKNITKPTNSATSTLNKVASSRTKIPKLINPPNLNCFKLRKIQFIIVQIKRNYL